MSAAADVIQEIVKKNPVTITAVVTYDDGTNQLFSSRDDVPGATQDLLSGARALQSMLVKLSGG
jgi:hypothetical protein